MIKGHINIPDITYSLLEQTVFTERTETREAGGYWQTLGVETPNFPVGADIVYQTFENLPTWATDIASQFSDWVFHYMVTINKLPPGCFIPPHKDTLYRITQKVRNNCIDVSNMVPIRINLFLQDRELGHIFEMDGILLNKYAQGDYLVITPDKVHSVVNLGYLNRYTMQITGFARSEDIS